MMFSPVFLIVSLVCVVYSKDLPECKRRECAQYKVIEVKDGYEKRIYEAHKIATILSKDTSYRQAMFKNFMPLFQYIQGANERIEKIDMTIPVFNKIQMSTKGGERKKKDVFEMAFVMPQNVKDPPKPANDEVKIKDFGPVTVYALSFPGYATEKRLFDKQEKLRSKLDADGVKYNHTRFYSAGYNSPWQIINRHNDVFYVAKDD